MRIGMLSKKTIPSMAVSFEGTKAWVHSVSHSLPISHLFEKMVGFPFRAFFQSQPNRVFPQKNDTPTKTLHDPFKHGSMTPLFWVMANHLLRFRRRLQAHFWETRHRGVGATAKPRGELWVALHLPEAATHHGWGHERKTRRGSRSLVFVWLLLGWIFRL